MIGWDLLYELIVNDLKTESDIIVAITHWYLIKQAGFRCLGTGDEVKKKRYTKKNVWLEFLALIRIDSN